jgi:hypothetical protein
VTEDERNQDLLEYMWEGISRVEEYRREEDGPMVQDAVLRRLETLADAAGQLSDFSQAPGWPEGLTYEYLTSTKV